MPQERPAGMSEPRTAGLDGSRTAAWISPRTAAGWSEPRTAALTSPRTAGLTGGPLTGLDGGLVLARGRILSRHRRIPSLQLSPVVSGRSTGRWKLAPCQNSDVNPMLSLWPARRTPRRTPQMGGKTGKQKLTKTAGKGAAHFLFWVRRSVTVQEGPNMGTENMGNKTKQD